MIADICNFVFAIDNLFSFFLAYSSLSACKGSGWAVLVYSCMGAIGLWKDAWEGAAALDPQAFEDAGGNGHSLTNTLWYIATRPIFDMPFPQQHLPSQQQAVQPAAMA